MALAGSVVLRQESPGFTVNELFDMAASAECCHGLCLVFQQEPPGFAVNELFDVAAGAECCPELGLDETFGGRGSWDSCCSSQPAQTTVAGRRKRRRIKRVKNEEEVESRRMTHIAVERNRRKQMNEHLAVLRSLMPASYAQRGDQASIVGGAIDFVKKLEQIAHSLEAQKRIKKRSHAGAAAAAAAASFPDFFTFPHGSSRSSHCNGDISEADAVEVVVLESHAEIKIFARWRPRQLLKLLVGMQALRLPVLHLNVATVDEMVLYTLNGKVEDECRFTSADEIATAVHQITVARTTADLETNQIM